MPTSAFAGSNTTTYMLPLGGGKLITAYDKNMLGETAKIDSQKTMSLNKTPDIAKMAAVLKPGANAYLCLNISEYIKIATSMMQAQAADNQEMAGQMAMPMMMMGMFSQINGTIGSSISLDDGYIQTTGFIPNELIQSVVQMGVMMEQQMGGGQEPASQDSPPNMF